MLCGLPPARCGVLFSLAVIATGVAGCQTSEPGRRRGINSLKLTRVDGYVEYYTRRLKQEQRSKVGAGKTRSAENTTRVSLKLETDGYVYHPNLLDFALGVLVGLEDREFEDVFGGRHRTSGGDGSIVEFNFNGQFFKKKSYPGSIYARRYRSLEPRPFQASLESTTTNVGLTWQRVHEKNPMTVQFNHTDVKLDPLNESEANGRQKNTFLRFETSYKFSASSILSFVWDRQSVKQEPFILEYDSNELTLSHSLNFGPNNAHVLDSDLNYFNQKGTYDIERTRWREILRFEHTDRLRSWYLLEILKRRQGLLSGVAPLEEESVSLTATVEHELYDSLVSQFVAFGQFQEFKTGLEIDRYGVQGNFDYRKKNRWGKLVANYRIRDVTEDREGRGHSGEVIDEFHTFVDPDPVRLSGTNILVGSILITAEDGFTTYRMDRDFTATVVGDRTELERVPTGRIPDGGKVLVDYLFRTGGAFTLDTLSHDLMIRQDYDFGLSPYYRLHRQDQTIKPKGALGAIPENITAHIVGVEFRKGRFRFLGEYENHDSNINPFDAIRLTADYKRRFSSGGTGSVKARWSKVDHKPPSERKTRFFSVETRYRHPITDRLTVESSLLYRNENDARTGRDEGIDLDLALEWTIRATEIRIDYNYGKFDDDFSQNEFSTLYVQVRRHF